MVAWDLVPQRAPYGPTDGAHHERHPTGGRLSALEGVLDVLRGVLDVLAGLLDLGLALVRLALGLHAVVVGRRAGGLLGLALRLGRFVRDLVVEPHADAPFVLAARCRAGGGLRGPTSYPAGTQACAGRSAELQHAVLQGGVADGAPVAQVALAQPPRLAVALVGQLVEGPADVAGREVHQRHLADR